MERLWKMWKMLQFGRTLKSDLRAIATVEPSADLWTRIEQEVNALPAGANSRQRFPVSRRLISLFATCLLFLVVGVGAVGAQQGWFTWRRPSERQIGPFVVSGYFYGQMEYYDENGTLKAVQDEYKDINRGGYYLVRSSVPGTMVLLTSPEGIKETYTLYDAANRPIARLVVRRQSENNTNNPYMTFDTRTLPEARRFVEVAWEWQINRWRTGSQSMEETPLGVTGYNAAIGLIWSLRGTANITVETTDGTMRPQRGETPTQAGPLLAEVIAEYERDHPEPEFNAIYRDNVFRILGFGRHELRDKNGIVILIATIEQLKTPE